MNIKQFIFNFLKYHLLKILMIFIIICIISNYILYYYFDDYEAYFNYWFYSLLDIPNKIFGNFNQRTLNSCLNNQIYFRLITKNQNHESK
ncbi:hypothetical protein ATP_00416 [Candidatus Phytoplasma mali]|uniref:Uncharacterized protein n=1 Tax=Phytoplasma mali (strain AT) TaxID=482235 RepID=B3QZJ6_PHYMT|nr:hypothetical protein [Candidatus Phytoplasma mali]CAP18603.1 hypothetical protein ATP_00416 [Candidatus Phytoplasma mali]